MTAADLAAAGVRLGVVAAALVLWFASQRWIAGRAAVVDGEGGGIGDRVHEWTAGWNAALHANPRRTDGLLVVSSALVDALGLWLVGTSVLGPSFGPFLGVLVLFALRQACQALVAMPLPRGMIWRHPGFPSLLVTYGTSNDLFFSGHTALCVLGALEIGRAGPPWLAAAAWAVAALQALFVLALRAHWTADVVAAALAAWACDAVAVRCAPSVDAFLASVVPA